MRLRLKEALGLLSIFLANPLVRRAIHALQTQLANRVEQALVQRDGQCGGMAFAALDYYCRPDISFPRGDPLDNLPTHISTKGARLHDYLWRWLIDSLTLNGVTFLTWTAFLYVIAVGRHFARRLRRR